MVKLKRKKEYYTVNFYSLLKYLHSIVSSFNCLDSFLKIFEM